MKLSIFLSIIFVLLLATVAPAQQVVTGVVLDSSGLPAAKAVVQLFDFGDEPVTTDEHGHFMMALKEQHSGMMFWAFSAEGMEFGIFRLQREEGNPAAPKFTIRMTSEVRVITGTVFDSTGNPVENAFVGGDAGQRHCTTGPDGTFRFLWNKEEPLLRLYAIKQNVGFNIIGTTEWRKSESEEITPPEQVSDGPFSMTLKKSQTVRVHVTDHDDKPIAGCAVFVRYLLKEKSEADRNTKGVFGVYYGLTAFGTETDESGNAIFDWVPAEGFAEIGFIAFAPKPGFVADAVGTPMFYGVGEALFSPENSCDLIIRLPRQVCLEGKVVYSDGSPASWVRVSANGTEFTDANGFFQLLRDPDSLVNIGIVSTREAAPGVFQINLGDGTDVKRLTFHLKKGTKLRGIVFNPDMTLCQEDFWIIVREKNPDSTYPDDCIVRYTNFEESVQFGGMYEFTLPPGQFEILGTCGQMRSGDKYFEISPDDEEIWIDLQLK